MKNERWKLVSGFIYSLSGKGKLLSLAFSYQTSRCSMRLRVAPQLAGNGAQTENLGFGEKVLDLLLIARKQDKLKIL